MKITTEHPLAFFDWYLENEIYKDLKEFYSHITEELYFDNINEIDKVNHTIKVINSHHQEEVKSEYITFTFEGHIKLKLKPEIKLTKEFIELGFQKRFADKKEVRAYADFLRIKLSSIYNKKACRDFPFLPLYFEQLDSLVNQYSNPSTNNTSKPLSFYFDMLFDNSIQSVKRGFIGNATLQENGYSYLQDHNYYIKEEMVKDNGSMPVFVTDIVKREDFLDRLLNFENTSIYKSIENEVSSKENIDDKVSYMQKVYDDIQVLLKRVLKLEDEEVRLVEDNLIEVINNLKDRYSSVIEYHDVYKYLIKESDVTYFKNKDFKYSFYLDLYELAYTLFLIDDTEIEEQDFVSAFTLQKTVKVNHLCRTKVNH